MDKFDIDIGGACNLRCPSCPQGNTKEYRLPKGFMAPELLKRIVAKVRAECRGEVNISLYNWAEPLLHPRLPELIRIVQDAGITCHLSSNLNILPNADAIMAANPASFRISNSGFSQEIYGKTHRGGDIERVKKNMQELVLAKKRNNATTSIYLYYHRYRHNLREESLMREFAADISIDFVTDWALFFPLEKILSFAEESEGPFNLTSEDRSLIDGLALPLRESLEASRKYRDRPCLLRDEAITLDFQGNANLCCGIFDARKYALGNYLDLPSAELQRLRQSHPMCERCMRQGAHVYLTYGIDEMDELALANIAPEDLEFLDLRYEIAWERRQQLLAKLYDRFFSRIVPAGQKELLADGFFRLQRFLRRGRRKRFGKDERS
jgi:organic radical activating enzyme